MKDQGCSPTDLHRFPDHVPSPSPSPLHQETPRYTSQYFYHVASSQGHHSLDGNPFEVPSHVTRQDQPDCAIPYAQPFSVMDAGKISVAEGRRVSRQDLQLVQNLIERCLQLYMNRKEVIETLLLQAKIEPGFTDLVWQKLEEENREFFKAYHVRLMVKSQIMIFNKLLQEHVDLVQKLGMSRAPHVSIPNGSPSASLQQQSSASCYAAEQTREFESEQLHHATIPSDSLVGSTNSFRPHLHTNREPSSHSGRMDLSQDMLAHHQPPIGTVQGSNHIIIKTEPECCVPSMFTFGADNIPETLSAIGDAPVVSFSNTDSNSTALPVSFSEPGTMGFLSQIPRNFSLSDLTAGFSQGFEILQNYAGCPYLADSDGFLDSLGRGCQVDEKRPDTISEGLSYDEFGSD